MPEMLDTFPADFPKPTGWTTRPYASVGNGAVNLVDCLIKPRTGTVLNLNQIIAYAIVPKEEYLKLLDFYNGAHPDA